jgi:NAD(P)-dependent dehydrogenase (short-subunit alcohol dehydrogenase family)
MGRLAGKVALITGAGAGIAKASALLFAKEGAKVSVCEINAEQGKETESAIKAMGGEACFIHPQKCAKGAIFGPASEEKRESFICKFGIFEATAGARPCAMPP